MNKKQNHPSFQITLQVENPEKRRYLQFCTENAIANPIDYPPLTLFFTLNALPDSGDVLTVSHNDSEFRVRVKNRNFFCTSGEDSGEVRVRLECDPA